MCVQLLFKLRADAHNNWRDLITGDESWFYYEYARDGIWTAQDDNTSEVENGIIPSRKSIPTVLWMPHGFHVMTMLDTACCMREHHSMHHGLSIRA
jgi:hypothetical protein